MKTVEKANPQLSVWIIIFVVTAGTFGMGMSTVLGNPTVSNLQVETYAVLERPVTLSFGSQGELYVGTDGGCGCTPGCGALTPIFRIGADGSSVVDYGGPIPDPDAVLFDGDGTFSDPGSVLVGGVVVQLPGFPGQITAIRPDESVVPIFGPTFDFANVDDMVFDSTGRMLFTNASIQKVFAATSGGGIGGRQVAVVIAFHDHPRRIASLRNRTEPDRGRRVIDSQRDNSIEEP